MTATPVLPETVDVTFAPAKTTVHRTMRVRVPDENTLAVWVATAERFQNMGREWRDTQQALAGRDEDDPDVVAFRAQRGEQATRALGRALKVISTALVDQVDRDWVEDSLLEGRFGLADALAVLSGAVDALRALRREQAPTAGPVATKKARRG